MFNRTPQLVTVSSLALVAWLPISAQAQIIETLSEVRVTASASGEGAGEGDLDETVLSLVGAVNNPTAHVNITNDITLGFISLKSSEKLKTSS